MTKESPRFQEIVQEAMHEFKCGKLKSGSNGIVAAVHLLRIINQFEVVIGTWSAPMVVSWIGFIAAGILSYCGFTLMCKEKGV